MEIVRKYQGMNILEIGNVLSTHVRFEYDILDKYEITKGIINEDVVDFRSEKRYDLILSISTLEHVGWDEKPRDNMKIPRAIENMKTLITSRGGMIVITLPLGYNSALDKLLKDGILKFSKEYHLVQTSKGNEWKEPLEKMCKLQNTIHLCRSLMVCLSGLSQLNRLSKVTYAEAEKVFNKLAKELIEESIIAYATSTTSSLPPDKTQPK